MKTFAMLKSNAFAFSNRPRNSAAWWEAIPALKKSIENDLRRFFQVFIAGRKINSRHGSEYAETVVSCEGVGTSRCVRRFLQPGGTRKINENIKVVGGDGAVALLPQQRRDFVEELIGDHNIRFVVAVYIGNAQRLGSEIQIESKGGLL
jgi:hypothetical protein